MPLAYPESIDEDSTSHKVVYFHIYIQIVTYLSSVCLPLLSFPQMQSAAQPWCQSWTSDQVMLRSPEPLLVV